MSKTVTIPSDVSRMEITINNKTYVYQGGATVTVPDEVAALLESNEKEVRKRPAGSIHAAGLFDGEGIPVYASTEGELRINAADVVTAEPAPEIFCINFTVSSGTATADKTKAEILAAIKAGKQIYGMYLGMMLSVAGYTATSSALTAITLQNAVCLETNTLTMHTFAFSSNAWAYSTGTYTLTPKSAES